jgi:hypothetical protein
VQLTGPGGLLTGLTKQVLETALQVEMAEHLGYEHSDPSGHGTATPVMARHRRPRAPMSARYASRCPVTAPARSRQRWCPSMRVGWPASTTPS